MIFYYHKWGAISSRFSSNSEASASELLENMEIMFPRYYMDSDVISVSKHNSVLSVVKGSKCKCRLSCPETYIVVIIRNILCEINKIWEQEIKKLKLKLEFVPIYSYWLVWTHREGTALKNNAYNEIYSGNS